MNLGEPNIIIYVLSAFISGFHLSISCNWTKPDVFKICEAYMCRLEVPILKNNWNVVACFMWTKGSTSSKAEEYDHTLQFLTILGQWMPTVCETSSELSS